MTINPLSSSIINLLSEEKIADKVKSAAEESGVSFSDILSESMNTVSETDKADKISALELLTGETDDMSGLLLDSTKAQLSLQFTLQIRNKIVESYNELMRTQV